MTQPVILVLCDGLGNDAAQQHMRYMEGLVRARRAIRLTTTSAHPGESRPNYETLHTGVSPAVHGVVSDTTCRRSTRPNTFDMASSAGLSTAAVAYSWVSELYVSAPFDPHRDSATFQPDGPVRHGCFYSGEGLADSEVFAHAARLVSRHAPHYVLVHPMGVENAGHTNGGTSCQYANAVRAQDDILAELIPEWIASGYAVIVTAGHGHRPHGTYGGTSRHPTATPLYLAALRGSIGVGQAAIDSERVAPTIWSLLRLRGPADAARPLVRPFRT